MLKIIFVLIGTFVGAGFASGKEIFNFFTIYQYNSFLSIIFFAILLFLVIYQCLNIKTSLKIENYREFIFYIEKKYKFFHHRFFLLIINIFLACSFYIMVIALSSLFQYQLHIAKWITILFTICICYIIFYKRNIHFIYVINSILMPILILFMISLCLLNINLNAVKDSIFETSTFPLTAVFMGLLYFSYNSLLLIPILFDLKIEKNKNNFKISFFYSLIIFLITFLVNLLLLSFYPFIDTIELPILYIANSSFFFFSFLYFFVVLSAIFTTMISSGYSFMSSVNQHYFNAKLILFLAFSFVLCNFSFSSLINFFYPLFGIIGLIQIFLIFFHRT